MLKYRVLLFVVAGRTETAGPVSIGALLTDDFFVIFKIFIKLSPTKCLSPFMPEIFVNNKILSRRMDNTKAP